MAAMATTAPTHGTERTRRRTTRPRAYCPTCLAIAMQMREQSVFRRLSGASRQSSDGYLALALKGAAAAPGSPAPCCVPGVDAADPHPAISHRRRATDGAPLGGEVESRADDGLGDLLPRPRRGNGGVGTERLHRCGRRRRRGRVPGHCRPAADPMGGDTSDVALHAEPVAGAGRDLRGVRARDLRTVAIVDGGQSWRLWHAGDDGVRHSRITGRGRYGDRLLPRVWVGSPASHPQVAEPRVARSVSQRLASDVTRRRSSGGKNPSSTKSATLLRTSLCNHSTTAPVCGLTA